MRTRENKLKGRLFEELAKYFAMFFECETRYTELLYIFETDKENTDIEMMTELNDLEMELDNLRESIIKIVDEYANEIFKAKD